MPRFVLAAAQAQTLRVALRFLTQAPWLAVFPGMAIFLCVLSVQPGGGRAAGRAGPAPALENSLPIETEQQYFVLAVSPWRKS